MNYLQFKMSLGDLQRVRFRLLNFLKRQETYKVSLNGGGDFFRGSPPKKASLDHFLLAHGGGARGGALSPVLAEIPEIPEMPESARTLVERFDRRGTEPFELYRARSRLYRNEILQENTRWKALAEIFTMHSFALL